MLNWSAQGEVRADEAGAEQIWLHLTVDVSLPLTCQRCLGPVDLEVTVNQSFRFVASEETAEAQDEEAEEDVLALSQDFKLSDLIEDEVLMALPVVPRHETCPVEVKLAAVDPGFDTASAEKRNPFAVLAKLQGDKSS
ncbi:MAG: YceD family protein [Rhodoferax sp.]